MGDKILDEYLSRQGQRWKPKKAKRLGGSADPIIQKNVWATDDPEEIPHKVDRTLKVLGTQPPDMNWLRPMPVGTVFHCRLLSPPPFISDWICDEYMVMAQYGRTTKLIKEFGDALIVDNSLFSNSHVLLQTL